MISYPQYDLENILNLPLMVGNDAGVDSIRHYLTELLRSLFLKEESFSGKRPFGNSGWKHDLYHPLVKYNIVSGSLAEEDGIYGDVYVEEVDKDQADALILQLIDYLGEPR